MSQKVNQHQSLLDKLYRLYKSYSFIKKKKIISVNLVVFGCANNSLNIAERKEIFFDFY